MTESTDTIEDGERAAIGAIGDDALKIFRAGLFMIVIYISILSLTLQTGGRDYVENIFNSFYTINGIVFWIGAMTVALLTHRIARRVTLMEEYTQIGEVSDKFDILNLSTASTFGLLISVFSLIVGLWEGWANTIRDSYMGIGIRQPLMIIGVSVIAVFSIYSVFLVLDWIRQRWGPIRKIIRLS